MHTPQFTADWFSHNIDIWEAMLAPHLASIAVPRVLEIGAFEGRSTLWLLQRFENLQVTVIDPWGFTANANDETYLRFQHNISPYMDRVTVFRGKSELARTMEAGQFDAIYIDGDHTAAAVLHDAVIGFELLKTGGLMIFDDYLGGDQSLLYPKPAIDFFHEAYGKLKKIELIHDAYQRIYKKMDGVSPPQF